MNCHELPRVGLEQLRQQPLERDALGLKMGQLLLSPGPRSAPSLKNPILVGRNQGSYWPPLPF